MDDSPVSQQKDSASHRIAAAGICRVGYSAIKSDILFTNRIPPRPSTQGATLCMKISAPQSVDMWGKRTNVLGVIKGTPIHLALPFILRCRDMSCEILSNHRPQVLRTRGEIAVLENHTPLFQSDIDGRGVTEF
jgi:hypothetical protein